MAGIPPGLTRTKARYELVMQTGREADFADTTRTLSCFRHLRFIYGVMLDYVRGVETTHSAKQIGRLIQAILTGVRDCHRRR